MPWPAEFADISIGVSEHIIAGLLVSGGLLLFQRGKGMAASLRHRWTNAPAKQSVSNEITCVDNRPPSEPVETRRRPAAWIRIVTGILLVLVLAPIAAIAVVVTTSGAAQLLGQGAVGMVSPQSRGALIFWSLFLIFVWTQLRHVGHLKSLANGARYFLYLVVLPLPLAYLGMGAVFFLQWLLGPEYVGEYMAPGAAKFVLGMIFFAMPAVHDHWLSPLFAFISRRVSQRSSRRLRLVGTSLLVCCPVLMFGWLFVRNAIERHDARATPSFTPVDLPATPWPNYLCSTEQTKGGFVTLSFVITKIGTVKHVKVIKSSGSSSLDADSVRCIATWRFDPATRDHSVIEQTSQTTLEWTFP